MSVKYLLIQPDEDGAPNTFMTEEQFQEWLDEDSERGSEWKLQTLEFMTEEDLGNLGRDQNYWGERKRLLLKVEFLQLKPLKITTKWVIEGGKPR